LKQSLSRRALKGAAGAAKGPCVIFPGKEVPAAAYCKAWAKKA
jgi:hypothetical protein